MSVVSPLSGVCLFLFGGEWFGFLGVGFRFSFRLHGPSRYFFHAGCPKP